jgi:hypothetical protein
MKIRQKVQMMLNEVSSTPSANLLDDNTTTIDYFQLIYECIETHQIFLNFVDFKTRSQVEPDVDLAILQAILTGKRHSLILFNKLVSATSVNNPLKSHIEQKQEQLYLALEWNRVDIVKNFIMKNEPDWKVNRKSVFKSINLCLFLQSIDLNDLFERALIKNQIAFVQLFLDHDFPLDDLFRNNNKLFMLYKNEVSLSYVSLSNKSILLES